MRVKCVVHSKIDVACCVVVVLLALEGCRNTQCLLMCVGDDGAVIGQDFRELGFSRIVWEVLKLRHAEGCWINEQVHCRTEHKPGPSVDFGLGACDPFERTGKMLQRAQRLKNWNDRLCLEDWQRGL